MSAFNSYIRRRDFTAMLAGTVVAGTVVAGQASGTSVATDDDSFELRYMLGSCMYGYTPLAEILPEVAKVGAVDIDIWPKRHGDQREQLDEMGEEAFVALLKQHDVQLGCITQYVLGPLGLKDELPLARRLGCSTIVTGGVGPKGLAGAELKNAVQIFIEKMKPHLEIAQENRVTIAIENHGSNLFETADALKWLVELCEHPHIGVALAPYHLPQNSNELADLIRTLGNRMEVFYAWQHGMGCMKKLPKEQELLQMPGRGTLDFRPLMTALKDIGYSGWTEIFMHPVPRGIPILDETSHVTDEINRSRAYLSDCLNAG